MVIDNDEYRAETQLYSGSVTLRDSITLVKGIFALVTLEDGSKNGEVFDLEGPTLLLDHIPQTFC